MPASCSATPNASFSFRVTSALLRAYTRSLSNYSALSVGSSIETSDNHHISYAYLSHVKPMPMTQNTGL